MKPVILLDADGVIVDFVGSFLAVANGITGLNVQREEITQWDIFHAFPAKFHDDISKEMAREGFCLNMQPLPGALEAIGKLAEIGDVVIVTSPWSSKTWAWERTEWLIRHANFRTKEIIHASAKQHVKGDILIDDKYENLVAWKRANPEGAAILWHAPYNAAVAHDPHVWRAKTWDEVLALVKAAIHHQPQAAGATL